MINKNDKFCRCRNNKFHPHGVLMTKMINKNDDKDELIGLFMEELDRLKPNLKVQIFNNLDQKLGWSLNSVFSCK